MLPPRSPITPVMAGISAALNFIRTPLTPRTPTSGKVGLSLDESEPLAAGDGFVSEKCELRIEGMTCGACVEVRILSVHREHRLERKRSQ